MCVTINSTVMFVLTKMPTDASSLSMIRLYVRVLMICFCGSGRTRNALPPTNSIMPTLLLRLYFSNRRIRAYVSGTERAVCDVRRDGCGDMVSRRSGVIVCYDNMIADLTCSDHFRTNRLLNFLIRRRF